MIQHQLEWIGQMHPRVGIRLLWHRRKWRCRSVHTSHPLGDIGPVAIGLTSSHPFDQCSNHQRRPGASVRDLPGPGLAPLAASGLAGPRLCCPRRPFPRRCAAGNPGLAPPLGESGEGLATRRVWSSAGRRRAAARTLKHCEVPGGDTTAVPPSTVVGLDRSQAGYCWLLTRR